MAVIDNSLCAPLLFCWAGVACYVFFLGYQIKTRPEELACPFRKMRKFVMTCFRRSHHSGDEKHALDFKVRESVERERVRVIQNYAGSLAHLTAWYMLLVGVLHLSVGKCSQQTGNLSFQSAEEIQAFGWFLVCMISALIPRLVTIRVIEIFYVGCSLWWLIRIALVVDHDVLLSANKVFLWRAVLGILVCRAGLTSVCNVLLMTGHCIALSLKEPMDINEISDLRAYYIKEEVATTIFIICVLFFFEGWVWAACRHTLEIKGSSQAEVTVRKLLSALCDAVVTLGPDLRISARAPKLANLLLQGRSAKALEGVLFLDFLADTDQDRFRQFLDRAPDTSNVRLDPEPAQALNVHLRDSSGITVQVQLFHSHFQDLSDEVCHLIGICEVGDTGGGRVGPLNHADARMREPSEIGSAGSVGALSDTETSFCGDSASVIGRQSDNLAAGIGASPAPGRNRQLFQPREVALAFDTLRFKVMDRHTPGCVIDASLLEKESLLQWVSEWSSSKAWMQDFVNAVLRPVNASSWSQRGGPPTSLSFQVSFKGTCALPADILTRKETGRASQLGPPTRLAINRVRLAKSGEPRIGTSVRPLSGTLAAREEVGAMTVLRDIVRHHKAADRAEVSGEVVDQPGGPVALGEGSLLWSESVISNLTQMTAGRRSGSRMDAFERARALVDEPRSLASPTRHGVLAAASGSSAEQLSTGSMQLKFIAL